VENCGSGAQVQGAADGCRGGSGRGVGDGGEADRRGEREWPVIEQDGRALGYSCRSGMPDAFDSPMCGRAGNVASVSQSF